MNYKKLCDFIDEVYTPIKFVDKYGMCDPESIKSITIKLISTVFQSFNSITETFVNAFDDIDMDRIFQLDSEYESDITSIYHGFAGLHVSSEKIKSIIDTCMTFDVYNNPNTYEIKNIKLCYHIILRSLFSGGAFMNPNMKNEYIERIIPCLVSDIDNLRLKIDNFDSIHQNIKEITNIIDTSKRAYSYPGFIIYFEKRGKSIKINKLMNMIESFLFNTSNEGQINRKIKKNVDIIYDHFKNTKGLFMELLTSVFILNFVINSLV